MLYLTQFEQAIECVHKNGLGHNMATKNNVDTSVAERRLRPIYDWLDNGNNKKACQEADKVLKKQPNFSCAKVLKGLALLRMGKEQECEALLSSVLEETPCDDPTLQAMTICYRELNKPDMICNLYASAAKIDPHNEDILSHLFMAYVRVSDYQKQHLTALSLYKMKPKNPYYFWAVMSIVLQAKKTTDGEEKRLLLLNLAERMVEKLIREGKIEAEQEVQLYVGILKMQGKLKEALEVIDGPLGEKLQSYSVMNRIELLIQLERWEEANVTMKKLLRIEMDNWNFYMNYFNTVFHLLNGESSESYFDPVYGEKPDTTVADCVCFLSQLQEENCRQIHKLRGPYLAQLEFFALLKARGEDAEPLLGSLVEMLVLYFHEFGEKQCTLGDLQIYLDLLNPNEVSDFLNQIMKIIQLEKGQLPQNISQMLQYRSITGISRYLGFHEALSYKSKLQLAADYMHCYHITVEMSVSKVLPTDIRDSDPFALTVANLLNDVWIETGKSVYVRDAIVVLENALTNSPTNFQIKLFLIKLYNKLGVSKAAHSVYELLDIKHMQLDSLGYLQCWPLLFTGQYQLASQLYETTTKFFAANYKDSADHLIFSYKFGSFLKISEFVDFRDRLSNSLHNSLVAVEKKLLDVFYTTSFEKTLVVAAQVENIWREKIDWNHFVDNRDYSVFWTVDPQHRQITPDIVKKSFNYELQYFRFRALLLRIILGLTDVTIAARANYGNSSIKCSQEIKNNSPSNEINCKVTNGVHSNDELDDEKNGVISKNNMNHCGSTADDKQDSRKLIEHLAEDLQSFTKSLGQNELSSYKDCMSTLDESRIFDVKKSSYMQFLVQLINIVISVSSGDKSINNLTSTCESTIQYAAKNLEHDVSELSTLVKTANPSELGKRSEILTSLTLIIEMVSIGTFVCGAINHILVKHVNSLVKKGKKKKENSINSALVSEGGLAENQQRAVCGKQLVRVVRDSVYSLDKLIVSLEDKWKDACVEDDNIYSLLKEQQQSVYEISPVVNSIQHKINDSYHSSLSEIRTVLKTKIKYLSELNL